MQLSINKVVLLTTGAGELSWYLIRKLRLQYQQVLIIITQQPPNIMQRLKFLLHLRFYANEFELVSMSDGLKLLQQGKGFTKRYLVISFDDGLASAKEVLPDINAFGVKPTFFVNSDPLINSKPLHNHQELICVHYSDSYKFQNIQTLRDKYHYMLQNDYMNLSSNDTTTNQDEFKKYVRNAYLNKYAIQQMLHENRIEIGTHSSCHSVLSGLDHETQYEIICETHKKIEALLSTSIPYFSFPFGKLHHRDYCSEYIAARTAKYVFSCNGGINQTPGINGVILRIGIHNEAVPALRSLLARQRIR